MNLIAWWGMAALAQAPSERWLTVKTEHFRVHNPEVASDWSQEAASRLEEWHRRVTEEVGWTPPQRIDVVVVDPYSDANGLAVPLAHNPRTMLFATPPEVASALAHYRSWEEDLLVHEDTHLVHMLRPPRNPLERVVYSLIGVGPVAAKSPRWVTEGYATVVEGRLTGFGRPNGDYRALLLRRLAQQGQMPIYSELNATSRWAGGSFAYFVGSAYLEWLEERTGEGSLRKLWARMTARKMRTFEEAFAGVFGAPPDELYGRFVAELTASAMAMEEAQPPDEETLLSLGWNVRAPDVSPDGERVAVPVFPRNGRPRVDIYELDIDDKAVRRRLASRERMLERDPLDVAAVPSAPPPHRRVASRSSRGVAAQEVRFLPDGEAVVFSAWTTDTSGRLRPDLYLWRFGSGKDEEDKQDKEEDKEEDKQEDKEEDKEEDNEDEAAEDADEPEGGEAKGDEADKAKSDEAQDASEARRQREGTRRLTRGQDLRTPDPSPDGTWAAAVRVQWGRTQLVRVDLATGDWTELTPLSPVQVDFPRVSPDGTRLAWLANAGEGFGVVIRELDSGSEWRTEPGPRGAVATSLAWSPDGRSLLATVGQEGFVEVHEVWREDGRGRGRLTHTAGGAWMAEPIGEDEVLFLSMSHRGWDLHRASLAEQGLPENRVGAAPARRPEPPVAPAVPEPVELQSRPYGLGPLDLSAAGGLSLTSASLHGQVELGVRAGDPVGRTEVLMLGSYAPGDRGLTGGRLSVSWRRLPMDVRLDGTMGGDIAFGTSRAGLSLLLERQWRATASRFELSLGGLMERALPADAYGDRQLGSLRMGYSWAEPHGGRLGFSLGGRASLGQTSGDGWTQLIGAGSLRVWRRTPLWASYEYGWSSGQTALDTFVLGGVPSSMSTNLAESWRVIDPAFGAGTVSGNRHDRTELSLGASLSPYVVRHRFFTDEPAALSAVGLRVRQSVGRQPFFRVPDSQMELGLACRVEYPGLGFDRQPCRFLNDWAGWISFTLDR